MHKAEIVKRPVEQVGSSIKKLAWSAILESLALVILGILFIVLQETIVKALAYLIGVFFIVKGGFQIISYYMEKGQNDLFNNGLLSGVISVLIGVALLIVGEEIAHVFRVVIGVIITYESLVRINTASKLSVAKIDAWKYILIVALIMLVIGVFITFNSGAVVTLIGWMMILAGIVGIVGDAVFIQYVNKVIDAFTGKTNSEK
jgi:uncharacterized membrane protein HdeD (DUF308 family)